MPELGLAPPFLKISYTLVNYPIKALIRVRHQMKRTREVRDMLCGLTSDDGKFLRLGLTGHLSVGFHSGRVTPSLGWSSNMTSTGIPMWMSS